MLQALLQAQHEAVLRAEMPPSPLGSLPAPLSTQPTSPWSGLRLPYSAVGLMQKGQGTPLHPPFRRGDKRRRKANRKPHVEYWHELLAFIDSAYAKKFGHHYPWSNLARKNLWNLARVHSAWEVMGLWDLYLAGESLWARRTGWSVYGVIREAGWLIEDSRFKRLSLRHEEDLATQRYGRFAKPSDILTSSKVRTAEL
jgi:hypothetical protein